MDGDNRNGRTPMYIMASLLALGASGHCGQRILRRLKRLCGWAFILCLLALPLSIYGTHVYETTFGRKLSTQAGQAVLMLLALSFGVSLLSGVLWCYLAVAKWLTDGEISSGESGHIKNFKSSRTSALSDDAKRFHWNFSIS